jgi:hypothetical protein
MASKGPSESAFKRPSFQNAKTTSTQAHASGATATQSPPVAAREPTQEDIALRAKAIWQAKGRPVGQDLQNWSEAERQLRAELKRR